MNTFLIVLFLFLFYHLYSRPFTVDFFSLNDFDDAERKRLSCYLDNLTLNLPQKVFEIHKSSEEAKELICFDPNSPLFITKNQSLKKRGNTETIFDLEQLEKYHKFDLKKLVKLATFADSIQWYTIPTLVKTRYAGAKTVHQPYAVLMRFRSRVHFGEFGTVKQHDIPFKKKKPIVIWRGGPSGNGFLNGSEPHIVKASREDLLKYWCHNDTSQGDIDVGLVDKWDYQSFEKYLKPRMEIKDMLKYKYLLSIEGNDVATNLKWAMSSQSVVIMPKPRVESWFCESFLKPYIHYVPVKDDFSDLLEVKKWCDKNPKKCKQIIRNANAYVKPFTHEDRERMLAAYVMETYMHHVDIILK